MYNYANDKRLDLIIVKLEEMLRGEFSNKLDISESKTNDRITTIMILINALSENWGRTFPSLKSMPYEPKYDFISILTFVMDDQGTIMDVNETACTALGRSDTEMLGKPFSEVLSKGSRKKWGKILKEIRKAKVPTKSDVYLDFLVDSQLVISRCCNLFLPKNSQQIHVNGVSHSLYSSIEKMHANKKEGGSTLDKELDLYVTRLYNHIQNNARLKNPDKTILHKDLGIKPVKLRHAFSQKYGLTVNKFILKERLKLARTELLKSKKGIKHVALECGFKNVSHFYFAFKAEFHMTPSELRKLGKP